VDNRDHRRAVRQAADKEARMIDETTKPDEATTSHGDETFEWTGEATDNGSGAAKSAATTGREWLAQLQTMIENAATQAAPVMREVAAKAAELAAVAGEKAGPVAARAAELTAEAGHKIAERSRDFATEIRRDQAARGEGPAADTAAPAETTAPADADEGKASGS
jgi:hypothetical protein